MANSVYTLQKFNKKLVAWGSDVAFTDAGVVNAQRSLVNQGIDTCTLTFTGTRPPQIGGLQAGELLRIMRDGVCWFSGRVLSPERDVSGSSENTKLILQGPWWWLANIVYRQAGLYYAVGDDQTGQEIQIGDKLLHLSAQPALTLASFIILSQGSDSALPLNAADTIKGALQYALAAGARFAVGNIDVTVNIPAEEMTDPTCADMVKKVLRWLPGTSCWFDYTQDPPVFNARVRTNRQPITLQMGGATPQVKEADLKSRPDLVLPGVALQYTRTIEVTTQTSTTDATGATTSSSSNQTINTYELDSAGPNPFGIGAMVATIQLGGGNVTVGDNASNSGSTIEPTPKGLAAAIYASQSVLTYDGSVTLQGGDLISGGNWIGRQVNITGGEPEWETMAADVQTVSESTANGQTDLTVGPPDHLGASDLASLLKANRGRTAIDPTTSTIRTGGNANVPPQDPPPPPPPSKGNQGGNGGPTKDDPNDPTTDNGFTGLITAYAGTYNPAPDVRGPAYEALPGGGVKITTPPLHAPPTSCTCTPQGSATGFYHSVSGGDSVEGYGSQNGVEVWTGHTSVSESYSQGTLDLTGFSPLSYTYAELYGTATFTNADGTSTTQDYQIPVSQYLGTRAGNFRVYAPAGALQVNHYDNQSETFSTSLTIVGLRYKRRGGGN